jgi:hypothetical protein
MATTENRTASTGSDNAAIVELQEMVERSAQASWPTPSHHCRSARNFWALWPGC